MSFIRAAVVVVCFGAMLCGVSAAGFSAQLIQSLGEPLANGANNLNNANSHWTTTALGGFTDGNFLSDGAYTIPVGGIYHFDAAMTVKVSQTQVPDQTVNLRIVRCSNGCNALCTGGSQIAQTLAQTGTYASDAFNSAFPPTFSLEAAFTGTFNTGDLIALCIDNHAQGNAMTLTCNANQCTFSGYSV